MPLRILTGKDQKSNTHRLATLAKEDENGIFFAKDMNSLNQIKKDHPELANNLFLAGYAHHAAGRQQTNAYVEDLGNSGYSLKDGVANGFTLKAATMLDVEHEEVPEGSAPESDEESREKSAEEARNTTVTSPEDLSIRERVGLDEWGNKQAKHGGEEPVMQQAEHVDHEDSYAHAYKSRDAQKEAEKNE